MGGNERAESLVGNLCIEIECVATLSLTPRRFVFLLDTPTAADALHAACHPRVTNQLLLGILFLSHESSESCSSFCLLNGYTLLTVYSFTVSLSIFL